MTTIGSKLEGLNRDIIDLKKRAPPPCPQNVRTEQTTPFLTGRLLYTAPNLPRYLNAGHFDKSTYRIHNPSVEILTYVAFKCSR